MAENQETSGFAIAALISTFFIGTFSAILAYFATKEIIQDNKAGKGLVIATLVLIGVLPYSVALLFGLIFSILGAGILPLLITGAFFAVTIAGFRAFLSMFNDQEFRQTQAIWYTIWFCAGLMIALLLLVVIGALSYFGVMSAESFIA